MNGADLSLLENLVRRESRSLLQYASDSFPWITAEEQEPLAQLQTMVSEEAQAAAGVAQFLAGDPVGSGRHLFVGNLRNPVRLGVSAEDSLRAYNRAFIERFRTETS